MAKETMRMLERAKIANFLCKALGLDPNNVEDFDLIFDNRGNFKARLTIHVSDEAQKKIAEVIERGDKHDG